MAVRFFNAPAWRIAAGKLAKDDMLDFQHPETALVPESWRR